MILEPLVCLDAIVQCGGSRRPAREPAGSMWALADHTLAAGQGFPNRPISLGQRVHWWRGAVILTGHVTTLHPGDFLWPARVRSNGHSYKPAMDDYCDESGRRSKPR